MGVDKSVASVRDSFCAVYVPLESVGRFTFKFTARTSDVAVPIDVLMREAVYGIGLRELNGRSV